MEGNTRAGLENGAQHRERQWETIKEKLKGHWHSKGSQPFDKVQLLQIFFQCIPVLCSSLLQGPKERRSQREVASGQG